MRNDVIVNDELYSLYPWRDDCPVNPVSPQYGTWEMKEMDGVGVLLL